jgi:hypothetical protein
MNRILLMAFLCLTQPFILEAQTIKIFNENKDQGYVLYAINSELYPFPFLLT